MTRDQYTYFQKNVRQIGRELDEIAEGHGRCLNLHLIAEAARDETNTALAALFADADDDEDMANDLLNKFENLGCPELKRGTTIMYLTAKSIQRLRARMKAQ